MSMLIDGLPVWGHCAAIGALNSCPPALGALLPGPSPLGMVPQPLQPARTARILVIEDEVLTRALIAEELRLAGFSVIEADRADDALTYIKAGKQVDLVFSDIQMPRFARRRQLAV